MFKINEKHTITHSIIHETQIIIFKTKNDAYEWN
jgi:hypothetical protein